MKMMFENSNGSRCSVKVGGVGARWQTRITDFKGPHSQCTMHNAKHMQCEHFLIYLCLFFNSAAQPRMNSLEIFAKAIDRGKSTPIESLLASGSINVNARLPRQFNPPPLVLAVRHVACRVDIVEMLLNAGAHIDGVDDKGKTACFFAVQTRNADVLTQLLARRPNLELKDKSNRTPLRFSLKFNGEAGDCLSVMLINAGASLDGLPDGSLCRLTARSTSAIQALLNRGVVVSQLRDARNFTPLHEISLHSWSAGVDAAANMLINVGGVDVEARTSQQITCTALATFYSRYEALRCFINAGADVNCVDEFEQTPLHRVTDYRCSVLLLAAGANINVRNWRGLNAFQEAEFRQRDSVLPAFIASGADPSDLFAPNVATIDAEQVEMTRRDIAKARLDFVRIRAMQVCIGLQSLRLDALQLCEILQLSFSPVAHLIAFHQWWAIATTVKHFHQNCKNERPLA
jgi:ankyrin repeat protein